MRKPGIDMQEAYSWANRDVQANMPISAEARIVACANTLHEQGIGWNEIYRLADVALEGIIHTNYVTTHWEELHDR